MNEQKKQRRISGAQAEKDPSLNAELARKVLLEFEMIEVHGHSSDHFGEIEEQLQKIANAGE